MIEAVVFDLDDTLYREHDYVLSGFDAAGEWLSRTRNIANFGPTAREIFARGVRAKVFDEALRALHASDDEETVRALVEAYRAHTPTISLFPDALRTLDALRGRTRLGLLTDGWHAVQKLKVQALQIESRFDAIVYTDALGRAHWKPHPLPYETLARALNTDASRCLYVADNPIKDFITARKLGWRTLQIVRPGSEYAHAPPTPEHAAHRVIEDLEETLGEVLA